MKCSLTLALALILFAHAFAQDCIPPTALNALVVQPQATSAETQVLFEDSLSSFPIWLTVPDSMLLSIGSESMMGVDSLSIVEFAFNDLETFTPAETGLTASFDNADFSPSTDVFGPGTDYCGTVDGLVESTGYYQLLITCEVWLSSGLETATWQTTLSSSLILVTDDLCAYSAPSCADPASCNYSPDSSCPNAFCIYPQQSIEGLTFLADGSGFSIPNHH